MSTARRRQLEVEIRDTLSQLAKLLSSIDPIRQPTTTFDPSNPKLVGRFVALALVAQERQPLAEIGRFYGSGVYALYYSGDHPIYSPLTRSETPIYVGKAAPASRSARTSIEQGERLGRRLMDHRKSIGQASDTLALHDFAFRALVVQSGWETAAEDYLIHLFAPIWNNQTNILYGVGKHGDSAETRANKRSPWDTIHPGRPWASASNVSDAKPREQIIAEIGKHFAEHPVYYDLESLLNTFIDELRQV